jgi:hypothetical protein
MRNLTILSWLLTTLLALVSIGASSLRLAGLDERAMLWAAVAVLVVACMMLTTAVVRRREARRRLQAIETIAAAVAGDQRPRLAALIAAEKASSGELTSH